MSVEALTWAWSQIVGDAGAKAVLVALANFADEDGRCWPGIARLAHMTDQSERTIQRHIKALVDGAFIRREPRVKETGARDRDAFVLLAPPGQLTRTRGTKAAAPGRPGAGAGPGVNLSPPVRLSPAPVTKPGDRLSPPGDRRGAPRCHPDAPPVTTVAGQKDDPSLNHQSTRAREASAPEPAAGAGGEGGPEFAFEANAAAVEPFRRRWAALRQEIGARVFDGWFGAVSILAIEPVVRLKAQNSFYADTISERYGRKLRKHLGESVEITHAAAN